MQITLGNKTTLCVKTIRQISILTCRMCEMFSISLICERFSHLKFTFKNSRKKMNFFSLSQTLELMFRVLSLLSHWKRHETLCFGIRTYEKKQNCIVFLCAFCSYESAENFVMRPLFAITIPTNCSLSSAVNM